MGRVHNHDAGVPLPGLLQYRRRQLPGLELAANIGNSTINLAGLVPWGIAASVPLTTMEVGPEVLLLSFYLYLLPLWCWLKSKK